MEQRTDQCVNCKKEAYLNPLMKLTNSHCGHRFCETCIQRGFLTRQSIKCPVCGMMLYKNDFSKKWIEEREFEREMDIRRGVRRDYNKRRGDFKALKEYNDFLEEVEDIVYNLVNGIDVEATQARIARYKKDNEAAIAVNRARQVQEQREMDARLEAERQEAEAKRRRALGIPEPTPAPEVKYPVVSAVPARPEPARAAPAYAYVPQPVQAQMQLPKPAAAAVANGTPATPAAAQAAEPVDEQQLEARRRRAGGWRDEFVTRRAIEEALAGLQMAPE
eukprot:TRINITY_DN7900_c0_g1_i1.p1 TRINITY_DN7900_c0_g1~~TRINITY_DN7900_c0_g1_i1.p1  ORF type:complete len:277 (-),score=57.53 TRINITY_DN7900_c0_g1_i1:24-854(-)